MDTSRPIATPVRLNEDGEKSRRMTSLWRSTLRSLFHNRSAIMGMMLILLLIGIAAAAPVIATHNPIQSMIGIDGETPPIPRKPPCIPMFGCTEPLHWMGLDLNGRDVFSRIVYGAQTSLFVGFSVTIFALSIGTVIGLVSGYVGGWVDDVIMRLMDVLLAFPSLLLAITIVTIRGPGLENALLAISIVSIPIYARLTRASVLSVKELEFVTAARALGAGPWRLIFQQILPNVLTPLIVQGTLGVGTAVIEAAALAFLGLGAQPPTPEWGQMLSEARNYVFTAPHMVFFPGISITLTVLGFNLLGDGLRDALDPRLRGTD
ncbi:MAG TPA: ABC transporter permease [Phototrophicaceae bacterium]|jgi:ABC-type dipeptide/oligopeptide/nickel transport system permease subunit|nr:ABC transporter permease [Phototrophicaceae bacterium]